MKNQTDYVAIILLSCFFILLSYAGYLSYKSIDWDVLKRLESSPIAVPTLLPTPTPDHVTPTISPKKTR